MTDLRKTASEIGRLASRLRAKIKQEGEEIGRIEARRGRDSNEYWAARKEWSDMLDHIGSISSELNEVAMTIRDVQDEYDI